MCRRLLLLLLGKNLQPCQDVKRTDSPRQERIGSFRSAERGFIIVVLIRFCFTNQSDLFHMSIRERNQQTVFGKGRALRKNLLLVKQLYSCEKPVRSREKSLWCCSLLLFCSSSDPNDHAAASTLQKRKKKKKTARTPEKFQRFADFFFFCTTVESQGNVSAGKKKLFVGQLKQCHHLVCQSADTDTWSHDASVWDRQLLSVAVRLGPRMQTGDWINIKI